MKLNRRNALLALASGSVAVQALSQDQPTTDQVCVIEAGMTREEAECWSKVAEAAAFFDLPEQRPMDRTEVATAIHVIQNKLLARPTYRKYVEEKQKKN